MEGPHYFDDDAYTDMPEKELVAEVIREKALLYMRDEIPHGIAVVVERFKERPGTDLVDIDVNVPLELKVSDDAQIIRGGVTYKSQAQGRITGTHTMTVPAGWTVSRGAQANLLIYHTRGQQRIGLEYIVPKGTKGTFPITFVAHIGDRTITKTAYVHIK